MVRKRVSGPGEPFVAVGLVEPGRLEAARFGGAPHAAAALGFLLDHRGARASQRPPLNVRRQNERAEEQQAGSDPAPKAAQNLPRCETGELGPDRGAVGHPRLLDILSVLGSPRLRSRVLVRRVGEGGHAGPVSFSVPHRGSPPARFLRGRSKSPLPPLLQGRDIR